jgi:hypothetical protein
MLIIDLSIFTLKMRFLFLLDLFIITRCLFTKVEMTRSNRACLFEYSTLARFATFIEIIINIIAIGSVTGPHVGKLRIRLEAQPRRPSQ